MSKKRRREPSMPKVSILNNKPTLERESKAPEGIEQSSGTRAYRVRSPIEIHKAHFDPALIEAAARYLKNREAVETAAKLSGQYDGTSAPRPKGGVRDAQRADAAELAFVEAKLEEDFMALIELLVAGVEAHRSNQPKTVGDIARRVLGYGPKNNDQNTAAGVGMLWGALTRLASIYIELRAYNRQFSTAEEIALRIQERRRQAETAKDQFQRESNAA